MFGRSLVTHILGAADALCQAQGSPRYLRPKALPCIPETSPAGGTTPPQLLAPRLCPWGAALSSSQPLPSETSELVLSFPSFALPLPGPGPRAPRLDHSDTGCQTCPPQVSQGEPRPHQLQKPMRPPHSKLSQGGMSLPWCCPAQDPGQGQLRGCQTKPRREPDLG